MSYQMGSAKPEDGRSAFTDEDAELPERGRSLRPALLIVVMAVFAGGLWFAYDHMGTRSPDSTPLIRADDRATKIRPDQPGGMPIPNLDKRVYDMGRQSTQVEQLLPPPETPLPSPAPAATAPIADAPANPPQPSVTTQAPSPALPETPVAGIPAPQAAAPSPAAPPATTVTPAAPPIAAPAPAATAAPAVAASPPTAHPAATGSGFRLQLGALRTEDAAKNEWARLKQENKDLLGAYAATWPRANLGDRGTFYRLQAGPIRDGAAAERICTALKHRDVGCILVRP